MNGLPHELLCKILAHLGQDAWPCASVNRSLRRAALETVESPGLRPALQLLRRLTGGAVTAAPPPLPEHDQLWGCSCVRSYVRGTARSTTVAFPAACTRVGRRLRYPDIVALGSSPASVGVTYTEWSEGNYDLFGFLVWRTPNVVATVWIREGYDECLITDKPWVDFDTRGAWSLDDLISVLKVVFDVYPDGFDFGLRGASWPVTWKLQVPLYKHPAFRSLRHRVHLQSRLHPCSSMPQPLLGEPDL